MTILFVIDKMKNFAGIERILTCKMNYFAKRPTVKVYLTTYEQKGHPLPFSIDERIIYHPMDIVMPQRAGTSLSSWLRAYIYARNLFRSQFKSLIRDIQPDIIVPTAYSFQVLDIVINAAHQQGAKTIMESHTKGETVTMAYKFKYNHILHTLISLWDQHILKSLKNCQCVVTLTEQDATFWKKYTKRIEVIPNMLTITPRKVIDYNTQRVISAGRYMSEKGFDRLLETWHQLDIRFNDWELYIFGNGDRTRYQETINKYRMESRVHLMPATNDIATEFSKSSIYVMTSRYEGFGLVLAEAMSCGLPCIAFDCPYGPREIITNGKDGYLVEDGNIKEFTLKLESLMSSESQRQLMGEEAINNISRYSPASIMSRWIELFDSL